MKKEDLEKALGGIEDSFIDSANRRRVNASRPVFWPVAAAAAVLLLSVAGVAAYGRNVAKRNQNETLEGDLIAIEVTTVTEEEATSVAGAEETTSATEEKPVTTIISYPCLYTLTEGAEYYYCTTDDGDETREKKICSDPSEFLLMETDPCDDGNRAFINVYSSSTNEYYVVSDESCLELHSQPILEYRNNDLFYEATLDGYTYNDSVMRFRDTVMTVEEANGKKTTIGEPFAVYYYLYLMNCLEADGYYENEVDITDPCIITITSNSIGEIKYEVSEKMIARVQNGQRICYHVATCDELESFYHEIKDVCLNGVDPKFYETIGSAGTNEAGHHEDSTEHHEEPTEHHEESTQHHEGSSEHHKDGSHH